MKTNLLGFSFFLFSLLFFTGCDTDDIEFDVSKNVGYSYDVAYSSLSGFLTNSFNETINPSTHPDLADYSSNLSSMKINSIGYSIDDYVGSSSTIVYDISISAQSQTSSESVSIAELDALNFNSLSGLGEQTFNLSASQISAINNLLQENGGLQLTGSITVSAPTNATFKFNFHIDTTVTVGGN